MQLLIAHSTVWLTSALNFQGKSTFTVPRVTKRILALRQKSCSGLFSQYCWVAMVLHWIHQLLCQSVQRCHVLFAASSFFCFTMDHIVKTRQNHNVCYLKHLILERICYRICSEIHCLWIMIPRLALYVISNFWVSRNPLSKRHCFVCNGFYFLSCKSRNRFLLSDYRNT